ncbi:MAG: BMP family ABC transporter substrate-binding protein [Chloroflexota bacterium]|nr:BMP family ABC transporter substrate-binding protein [Chloroflexota bacterium]
MFRKLALLLLAFALVVVLIAPAAAQDELVFGVVLVGPNDDRGWSTSHYEAGLYVEENMPGATMLFFESLNPADSPETTLMDVVEFMIDEGASVIFTTSDSFEEDTNVVAAAFPDVTFINITGSNAIAGSSIAEGEHAIMHELPEMPPANVGNFNVYMELPRLIAGCAAALTSESGSIGYLGALINPETRRLAASSYLGARYCADNYRDDMSADDISFEVVWIGFWFNIPGVTLDPTEVATGFLDGGADVIISGIDTTEAITVAGQYMAEGDTSYGVPYGNVNGCSEAPDACLGAAYYNWGPAYLDIAQRVADGSWSQEWLWLEPKWDEINDDGLYTDGDTSVAGYKFGNALSMETIESLKAFAQEIHDFQTDPMHAGEMFLWSGPLNLQDGTELAGEGEAVTLLDIWFIPQLLEGMVGASE